MKKYYGITTFLIFGVFSILTTFYFPYLNQEIGLSLSEVGRVVSVGALFTLFSPLILSLTSFSSVCVILKRLAANSVLIILSKISSLYLNFFLLKISSAVSPL